MRSSLENAAFPEAYSWITPQVDGEVCWGCGICERVCPHQALKVYLAKEEDQRYLLHYPDRCTRCGLCQSICPDKAITGYTKSLLPAQVKFFITPVLTTHCAGCGGPLRPVEAGSLCSALQSASKEALVGYSFISRIRKHSLKNSTTSRSSSGRPRVSLMRSMRLIRVLR